MRLTTVLRRAGIVAAAALLATSLGGSVAYAQSGGASPPHAEGTPARKPASKKSAAKPSVEKPQKPIQNGSGANAMQGFRPDPVSNY